MRLEVKEDVKKRMNNLLGEETEAYVRSDKLSEKLLRSDCSDLDFYRKWKESNYIQLTPPEISCPDDTSHIISVDLSRTSSPGYSIKPGNVFVHIRSIVCSLPSTIPSVASVFKSQGILQVCAILNLLKKLLDAVRIKISKEQAYILIALWQNCDKQSYTIPCDAGYKAANDLLAEWDEQPLSFKAYHKTLDSLSSLHCIDIKDDTIELTETVYSEYCVRSDKTNEIQLIPRRNK
jgi:hypothetical protein